MINLFKRKKRLRVSLVLSILLIFTITGCGKNTELENYKANMNQFFENIKIYDASINALALNPDSETAVSDLLALLDSMSVSFEQMASLDVPDGFPGVEQLADEASEYMSTAVSYYHQAYDGEYDAALENVAHQNYEYANVRLQYIVSIIHGDIPEEIFTYENGDDPSDPVDTAPDTDDPENLDDINNLIFNMLLLKNA